MWKKYKLEKRNILRLRVEFIFEYFRQHIFDINFIIFVFSVGYRFFRQIDRIISGLPERKQFAPSGWPNVKKILPLSVRNTFLGKKPH